MQFEQISQQNMKAKSAKVHYVSFDKMKLNHVDVSYKTPRGKGNKLLTKQIICICFWEKAPARQLSMFAQLLLQGATLFTLWIAGGFSNYIFSFSFSHVGLVKPVRLSVLLQSQDECMSSSA